MSKTIVSCGLGVDSTALLILLKQQKFIPDAIIFADTGGEKPETYHFKEILEKWLTDNGFPELVTVRYSRTSKGIQVSTLEEQCLAQQGLPSIAYGKKQCSFEWKKTPVDRYISQKFPNEPLTYLISYNADERKRAKDIDSNITYRYPLIEADWGRERCLIEIVKSGLPVPCKSACFFCPSTKKTEIKLLAKRYPDLMKRAIAIEHTATTREKNAGKFLGNIKGLGRNFNWENVVDQDKNQLTLFEDSQINACHCIEAGVNIEQYWKQF